jgi:CheY-like chemotaxis protein
MENHQLSVLIVEDDKNLRYSLTELLSYCGYKVHGAQDGLAALEQLERVQPDILLSDLNMPRMDGYELLSIIRSRYPGIRVVAMSGAYTDEQIPGGVAADAFYPKGGGGCALLIAILTRVASRHFSPSRTAQESQVSVPGESAREISRVEP